MTKPLLEENVLLAQQGDAVALEAVVRAVQKDIYNLALRMLWCPDDAADATQEILLKLITRLASFEGRSAFRTWAYRVALNHLLNQRKSRVEAEQPSFEQFADDLAQGLSEPTSRESDPEYALLVQEVRVGCTHAMLICLDREHRAAFVLGEILELSNSEGAQVLGISDVAYRKRLSRAKRRLVDFMAGHCGLVNTEAACRCHRRIDCAVEQGVVRHEKLLFAGDSKDAEAANASVAELSALQRAVAVYRSNPQFDAPKEPLETLKPLFNGQALKCLQ
ncbi:MAG: RNA polymerase sigma factor [Pseudomonadota bacterium]|nr:RNA polymerase sigma factor [Pseudomonadota bacterium]